MIATIANSSPSFSPSPAGTFSARRESRDSTESPDKKDKTSASDPTAPRSTDGKVLSEKAQQIVEQLKASDREVRAHEAAHLAAAAGLAAGGANFSYTRGPDGQLYATGGEVSIDVSPVTNNPEATIAKARQIQRAALAPAQPSGQDRAVAARAVQLETEARQEIQQRFAAYGESDFSARQGNQLDLMV